METETPLQKAILKDLELQWKDHQHMRDQTWKTLASTIGLLLAAVGIALRKPGGVVMVSAYLVVMFSALLGWATATHHRLRQHQKFEIISIYEKELGLLELKKRVLDVGDSKAGIASKVFTANFIGYVQLAIGLVAAVLIISMVWPSA